MRKKIKSMRLPKNTLMTPQGTYLVRISRNGVTWRRSGLATLPEAADALRTLEKLHGPASPCGRPKKRLDPQEMQQRIKNLPKHINLTGIYLRKTGWVVALTRRGKIIYVGHYQCIDQAILHRDKAVLTHPKKWAVSSR